MISFPRSRLRSSSVVVALIAATLALAACGGGGGGKGGNGGLNPGGSTPPGSNTPPPNTPPTTGEPPPQTPLPGPPKNPDPDPGESPETGAPEYFPLYAPGTPIIEDIQSTGANGELVTKIGFRTVGRHAREGGEDPTDPDKGPGQYLLFPAKYFQNRSFGLEVHDYVPLGQSKIEIFLRVNDGKFDGTTFSLFRSTKAGDRGYGWNLNTQFKNSTLGDGESIPLCGGDLPVDSCKVVVTSNWSRLPHDALRMGDKIELSPASRLERWGEGVHANDPAPPGKTQGDATIDDGRSRYYSFEQLYVVGKGVRPWYGVEPVLDSEPLPDEMLSGGQTTLSYNYSEEPMRLFQQAANNIGTLNVKRFVQGRRLFHTSFLNGHHSEHENDNPVFTEHSGQLGPRFNQERCISCHELNGRGVPPAPGVPLDTMAVLTAAASEGAMAKFPDPTYGFNVQQQTSVANAPDFSVTVASYETSVRTFPDGERVELQKPVYAFKAGVPAAFSVRQAQQVFGVGLLEALDEKTILALADPQDRNKDGIRGVPNWVTNPETGRVHLGRFGWKAGKFSVREQIGDALMKDMGVTSPVYPSRGCQQGKADCHVVAGKVSLSETELQRLSDYLRLLAVPAQRGIRTVFPAGEPIPPEHDVDEAKVASGRKLFVQAGCGGCHMPELKTGKNHPFQELREQTIRPYTDLLLHDMGPELADTLSEGKAAPAMWRTAPLWGVGALPYVQGGAKNVRYLHDARARTLTEAIAWHGGEGSASRSKFESMSKADREALLTFLGSL